MSFFMTINGRRVKASEGETVLTVCKREGFAIPTLCHHESVEPSGSCRLCMVSISWPGWDGHKLVTACLYPAEKDLIVETDTQDVHHVRKNVLDLLLARSPDAKIVQELASEYGVQRTSFEPRANPDLCILCGLCVRVCETAATSAISMVQRGHDREIGTPWGGPPDDCIGCLACANVCPTGFITFEERGGVRKIWDREFKLKRCETTGAALPITEQQAEFLAKRQEMDPSYFATSPKANLRKTAETFGKMSQWDKLGMETEEVE